MNTTRPSPWGIQTQSAGSPSVSVRLKQYLMLSCLLFLSALVVDPALADDQITLGSCTFTKTYTEDFKDFRVRPWRSDGTGWIAHTPWAGDFGDAAFTDPAPGFPFTVTEGTLKIEARKDETGKWRSGLIASADGHAAGFSQRFGYFEMRAKLPKGDGLWPAFWLATNKPTTLKEDGVEIDVIEHYGRSPGDFHSNVHVWSAKGGEARVGVSHVTQVPSGSLYTSFHTYGVDVEADDITVYLDRKSVWRTATPAELKRPLMILANLALGSGWPIDKAPSPSIMEIAYIHVFERAKPCPSDSSLAP